MMQGEGRPDNCEETSDPTFSKPKPDEPKEAAANGSENLSCNENVDVNTEDKYNENTSPECNRGEQCEKMEHNGTDVSQSGATAEHNQPSNSNNKSKDERNSKDKNKKKDRKNTKKNDTNVSKEDKPDKRKNRFENNYERPDSKYKANSDCSKYKANSDCSKFKANSDCSKYTANSDCTSEFVFFWKSHSPYSQWYKGDFTVDGKVFDCAEQWMMYSKAMLFGDDETAQQILEETDPRNHKWLGRRVQNFDQKKWDANCLNIVKRGNKAKFSQDEELLNTILDTHPKTLVEASPQDRIWGIGLSSNDSRARDINKWRGKNLLGKALTEVRDELIEERHGSEKDVQDEMKNKITDENSFTLETHKGSIAACSIPEIREDLEDITKEEAIKDPKTQTEEAGIGTIEHGKDNATTECNATTNTTESTKCTLENSSKEDATKEPDTKNNTDDGELVTEELSIDKDKIDGCSERTSTIETTEGTIENSITKESTTTNNNTDGTGTANHTKDMNTTKECTVQNSTGAATNDTTEQNTNTVSSRKNRVFSTKL